MKYKLLHSIIIIGLIIILIGFSSMQIQTFAEFISNFFKIALFTGFATYVALDLNKKDKQFEIAVICVNYFFGILSAIHSYHTFIQITPLKESFTDLMFNLGAIMLVLIEYSFRLRVKRNNLLKK